MLYARSNGEHLLAGALRIDQKMKSEDMLRKSCRKMGIEYVAPVLGATPLEDENRIESMRRLIADERGKQLCTAKLTDRLNKKRLNRQIMRNRVMPGMKQVLENLQMKNNRQGHNNLQTMHNNLQLSSSTGSGLLPSSAFMAFQPALSMAFSQNTIPPFNHLNLHPQSNRSVHSPRMDSKYRDPMRDILLKSLQSGDTSSTSAQKSSGNLQSQSSTNMLSLASSTPSLLGSALNSKPAAVSEFLRDSQGVRQRSPSRSSDSAIIALAEATARERGGAPPLKKRRKSVPYDLSFGASNNYKKDQY